MSGLTKIWRVKEKPEYTVEQTPGLWVIWGPCDCDNDEDCSSCGGSGDKIYDTCMFVSTTDDSPSDPEMVRRVIKLDQWTPERIQ